MVPELLVRWPGVTQFQFVQTQLLRSEWLIDTAGKSMITDTAEVSLWGLFAFWKSSYFHPANRSVITSQLNRLRSMHTSQVHLDREGERRTSSRRSRHLGRSSSKKHWRNQLKNKDDTLATLVSVNRL